jgi:hypothetical protein
MSLCKIALKCTLSHFVVLGTYLLNFFKAKSNPKILATFVRVNFLITQSKPLPIFL